MAAPGADCHLAGGLRAGFSGQGFAADCRCCFWGCRSRAWSDSLVLGAFAEVLAGNFRTLLQRRQFAARNGCCTWRTESTWRHDDKTEQATPRRRQKAREQGQVARSRELAGALIGFAGLLVLFGCRPTNSALAGALRSWTDAWRQAQILIPATPVLTWTATAVLRWILAPLGAGVGAGRGQQSSARRICLLCRGADAQPGAHEPCQEAGADVFPCRAGADRRSR